MAEPIKCVLLVDFDSIHRSLSASDPDAAERLGSRLVSWVDAIETGSLLAAKSETPSRRRILIRRCYADPKLLGDERSTFLSNGFQIIDCPPPKGREHNAAAIHMVLDTIDALDHPTGYEEFVFLSADTDLSPILIRLRAHNRTTAIYANAVTADSYKAIADAMIDESRLASILVSDDEPTTDEGTDVPAPQAERSQVEALARKVSAATNVPLFAPRTFAELFRHLAEEISENGFNFQTTAENVAKRMADAGRNVARRQTVFVVKGIALKGHAYSATDTADGLAAVFREQAIYLAENAGLELDDEERSVMSSWIVGHVPSGSAGVSQETEIRPDSAESKDTGKEAEKTAPAKSANTPSSRSARRKQAKLNARAKKAEGPKTEATQSKSASEEAKPAAPKAAAAPDKPAETPDKLAEAPEKPTPAPTAKSPVTPPSPSVSLAAKSGSDAGASPGSKEKSSPPPALSASRPTQMPTPPKPTAPPSKTDTVKASESEAGKAAASKAAVESSILAAIAEAVDVLVEDSGTKPKAAAVPDRRAESRTEKERPPLTPDRPAQSVKDGDGDEPESDDIGDEIQRIIASYSRNRNQNNKR